MRCSRMRGVMKSTKMNWDVRHGVRGAELLLIGMSHGAEYEQQLIQRSTNSYANITCLIFLSFLFCSSFSSL